MLFFYKLSIFHICLYVFNTQFEFANSARSTLISHRNNGTKTGLKEKKILRQGSHRQRDDKESTTHRDAMLWEITPNLMNPYSLQDDLAKLAKKYDQLNLTTEVIGRTAAYNNIVLLKISNMKPALRSNVLDKYLDEPGQKKILFIVHGLSVGGILNVRCLSQLEYFEILLGYYMDHLDMFDIYLIPMANPDGFQFCKNDDSWQKNLSEQKNCAGVYLDRNFDIQWQKSEVGPCSQFYPGASAACELEVQAIRRIFVLYSSRMAAYIHVHASSFSPMAVTGEAILYPQGYTDEPKDEEKYLDIRDSLNEMMSNSSFKQLSFHIDTLYNWYGKVTGTSVDYASSVYGIPYALEFAMQTYYESRFDVLTNDFQPELDLMALRKMWKPAISVVFDQIFTNTKSATRHARKSVKL